GTTSSDRWERTAQPGRPLRGSGYRGSRRCSVLRAVLASRSGLPERESISALSPSPLDTPGCDTPHERALERDEDDDDGNQRDQRGREYQAPLAGVLALEESQGDGQRPESRVVDDRQRPGELVPVAEEREDHRGPHGGTGERQDHAQERREPAGAVHVGGLLDRAGDTLKEPSQQERLERDRPHDVEDDEAEMGVQQAERPGLEELRDDEQH